jgi:hypothetical protein
MGERRDLWFILDALWVFLPFSLIGAVFGDSIRKDVLTRRQRAVAGLFSWMMGPLCGQAVFNDLEWSMWVALAVASAVPTIVFDVIGLVAALLRQPRDDLKGWLVLIKDTLVAALAALLPWRKP